MASIDHPIRAANETIPGRHIGIMQHKSMGSFHICTREVIFMSVRGLKQLVNWQRRLGNK